MEEYEEDDDTEDEEPEQPSTSAATRLSSSQQEEDDDKTEDEDEDPELSEWFKIEEKTSRSGIQRPVSDSETEADSDNEDVNEEDAHPEEDDGDDWVDVKPAESSNSSLVDVASVCLFPCLPRPAVKYNSHSSRMPTSLKYATFGFTAVAVAHEPLGRRPPHGRRRQCHGIRPGAHLQAPVRTVHGILTGRSCPTGASTSTHQITRGATGCLSTLSMRPTSVRSECLVFTTTMQSFELTLRSVSNESPRSSKTMAAGSPISTTPNLLTLSSTSEMLVVVWSS